MALLKEIVLSSGVTTNYHRIVSVNNITNFSSVIEVASYTSKAKRQEEKAAVIAGEPFDVFIHTQYLNKEYTPSLNVDAAYVYIKTLDMFGGYADDIES